MSTNMGPGDNPFDYMPAGTPPPGVMPNLIDPPSRGDLIIILDAIFVPLMLIAVFVRFLVRIKWTKVRGLGQDICIILAVIGSVTHFCVAH